MKQVTIPLPDGLDACRQKALVEWLLSQAEAAAPRQLAFESDPAFRDAAVKKITTGRTEIESGLGIDARESMRGLADDLGINLER